MTCIAGIVDNGVVYVGGDSAGVAELSITVRADSKVFRVGEFIFGFTTSFRMGQLLRYSFKPPKIGSTELYQYMCTDFIEALRVTMRQGGVVETDNGKESCGTFLVGVRGRLFSIEADFQVAESVDSYDACGCGESLAKGALYVLTDHRLTSSSHSPEDKLLVALQAAAYMNGGVRAPYKILSTRDDS